MLNQSQVSLKNSVHITYQIKIFSLKSLLNQSQISVVKHVKIKNSLKSMQNQSENSLLT
jgi:hypothetical protein